MASAGSSCTASGSGATDDGADLLANGTATYTLTPQADLELLKSDAPDPVSAGGMLIYTLLQRW